MLKTVEVEIMYGRDDIAAHQNPTLEPKSNGEGGIRPDITTGGGGGKRMHAIPRCCSLEGLTEINHTLQGVEVATLGRLDTILIRTVNSDYRILLLDPETGHAILEGGGQIPEPVEAKIIGSSFGGSIIRTGWIGVGLRMEAWTNDKYLRTSPVKSFGVEHQISPELATDISQ
jgi:hypothetical protein